MSYWFDVENLKKREDAELRDYGKNNMDNRSDFISYKMLYDGYSVEESGIKSHNLDLENAVYIAKEIDRRLSFYARRVAVRYDAKKMSIGDFGGVGFLASAFASIFEKVCSYDVAEYAGKYGREHFPNVQFITRGIEPDTVVDEGPFDIVVAYEFYPFTRTDEYDYGRSYIDGLFKNVKTGGIIVIGLPSGKERENLYKNW